MHSPHIYNGDPNGVSYPDGVPEQAYVPSHQIVVGQDGTVVNQKNPVSPLGNHPSATPNTHTAIVKPVRIGTV